MPRITNRQYGSVGNLGDVLKHAALVELASRLADTRSSVAFVDTHAFVLEAPLGDDARWRREVDARVASHVAYARYAAIERASLTRGSRYRCSSGLVLDALGERLAAATLGESNGATRAELRDLLRAEGHARVHVAEDAVAALEVAATDAGSADAVLVHVDPFTLPAEAWAPLAEPLDALCAEPRDAVVVVYRYTRNAPSPWPRAPRGTVGPVVEARGGPHEVAAYASSGLAVLVAEACVALGWRAAQLLSL